MNEEIKQIAQKCDLPIGLDNPTWAYESNIEKFAQMIIRNCIFQMVYESTIGSYENKEDVQNFTVNVTNKIDKRFGTEL